MHNVYVKRSMCRGALSVRPSVTLDVFVKTSERIELRFDADAALDFFYFEIPNDCGVFTSALWI